MTESVPSQAVMVRSAIGAAAQRTGESMDMGAAVAAAAVNACRAGDGEAIWFNGALIRVKSPGEWSGGAFSLVEVAMPEGRATGLHRDPSHETFHILEGELLFHVDGEEMTATTGDTVAIRRGVAHAFIAVSPLARFLVLNAPGTHDGFFRDGGVPAETDDLAAAPPPDLERTAASAQRHGVEFLGPPPFDSAAVRLRSG
jgi:quercetin dioxygenase-like cupin family protein